MAKAAKNARGKREEKGKHGGRREGSGKPTFFRGKSVNPETDEPIYTDVAKATSILMTRKGWDIMDGRVETLTREFQKKTGNPKALVSRSAFVEALTRKFGRTLTLADIEREDAKG